jgi:hypothetical protein
MSDSPALPTVRFLGGPFTLTEGDAGETSYDFTIALSAPAVSPVTVRYDTNGVTATRDVDFLRSRGEVTFAVGETEKTITVRVVGDTAYESSEIFVVQIEDVDGGAVLGMAGGTAVVTIGNDDAAALPTVSIRGSGPVTIEEGDAGERDVIFTVALSAAASSPVSVRYATSGLMATEGVDFLRAAGVLTFAPGELTKTVTVKVIGDTLEEGPESFILSLLEVTGGAQLDVAGTGVISMINDDDASPLPTVRFSTPGPITVTEGDEGRTPVQLTIALSAAATTRVKVNWETMGASATEGRDFVDDHGTLVFAPGELTKTITLGIRGDELTEGSETFLVRLTEVTGGAQLSAFGTTVSPMIVDDEPAVPVVSVTAGPAVQEGDSGRGFATFAVNLSAASTSRIEVRYRTADGTAKAGEDYEGARGKLVFEAGETSKTVTVRVNGDTASEMNEAFRLELSQVKGAAVISDMADSATATILNDDLPPVTVSIFPSHGLIHETWGGKMTVPFYVSLSRPAEEVVTVRYDAEEGTAEEGKDFRVTGNKLVFAPGETTKTIQVEIIGDRVAEANETFDLLLKDVKGASFGAVTVSHVTIDNAEAPVAPLASDQVW